MQVFTPEELDDEILGDLMEEIQELYEASEQTLIELELRPQDNELQRSLFRSVHTIKGDLGLVSFSPMIPILQHVEDLLDYLRSTSTLILFGSRSSSNPINARVSCIAIGLMLRFPSPQSC